MPKTPKTIDAGQISVSEKQALQFVSMFVHDLESPLVSLKTILRLLDQGAFDPRKPAHKRLLNSGRLALSRAEALIYDLLTAAQSGESDLIVNQSDYRLNEIIRDCCLMAEPTAAEYNVQLLMDLPEKDVTIKTDKALLERVLDNLIYNAVRHTPPRGKVAVTVQTSSDQVDISVTDTGSGIKDIKPDELFTIFKQTDYRVRGLHRGVGIGLYFCRLAVEKMGGCIKAENLADGGAIFRFCLPLKGITDEDGS